MTPKNSQSLKETKSRTDQRPKMQEPLIENAGQTEGEDRDLVHGDGGAIDIPVTSADMSKDD